MKRVIPLRVLRGVVIAFSLLLAFVVGATAPTIVAVGMYRALLATPDPESEYYRAMYDVCAAQTHQREMCMEAVAGFRAKGWYEQPSPGYEWPLPGQDEAPPGARPTPSDYPLQGG